MKPNPIFTHIVSRIVVYALGGNALSSPDADDGTNAPLILAKVMSDVVDLLEAGWQVVITSRSPIVARFGYFNGFMGGCNTRYDWT